MHDPAAVIRDSAELRSVSCKRSESLFGKTPKTARTVRDKKEGRGTKKEEGENRLPPSVEC